MTAITEQDRIGLSAQESRRVVELPYIIAATGSYSRLAFWWHLEKEGVILGCEGLDGGAEPKIENLVFIATGKASHVHKALSIHMSEASGIGIDETFMEDETDLTWLTELDERDCESGPIYEVPVKIIGVNVMPIIYIRNGDHIESRSMYKPIDDPADAGFKKRYVQNIFTVIDRNPLGSAFYDVHAASAVGTWNNEHVLAMDSQEKATMRIYLDRRMIMGYANGQYPKYLAALETRKLNLENSAGGLSVEAFAESGALEKLGFFIDDEEILIDMRSKDVTPEDKIRAMTYALFHTKVGYSKDVLDSIDPRIYSMIGEWDHLKRMAVSLLIDGGYIDKDKFAAMAELQDLDEWLLYHYHN